MAKGMNRIVWRRLDRQGQNGHKNRFHKIESKQLQIRNFTAEQDNGVYSCSLYSMPDNTLIDETQIELNLPNPGFLSSSSSTSKLSKKFDVHITIENRYNLDYGSNVKMSCHTKLALDDESGYSLEWVRFNDRMPNNSNVNENMLTLYNVSKSNLGEYVCIVTNKAGL